MSLIYRSPVYLGLPWDIPLKYVFLEIFQKSLKPWVIFFFFAVGWILIYHSLWSHGWDFTFICSKTIQAHISALPERGGMGSLPRCGYQDSNYNLKGNHHPSQSCEVEGLRALLFNLAIRHQQGLFPSNYRAQRKCHRILNMSTPCFSRRNVRSWLW